MKALVDWMTAVVVGALSGAVILGLLGRLAMAGLALAMGRASNLSLRSVLEVVVIATVVGAVGGVIRQLLAFWLHRPGMIRGVFVGISLFVLSGMLSWWAGGFDELGTLTLSLPTLVMVAVVYVVFGITIEELLVRRETRGGRRNQSARA
jgi:hypothetical protein